MPPEHPPLNRAERRALKHKRGPSKPGWNSGKVVDVTSIALLDDCKPYAEGLTTHSHLITRAAFDRLVDGSADEPDFDRVAMAINLSKHRAMEIDEGLANFFERAQDCMDACKSLYIQHRKFGFCDQGLEVVREAMDHHEAITDASSPQQMEHALRQVHKQLQRQAQHHPTQHQPA